MGEVYRALDERLGREVAVKVLGAEYLSDPEQLRRFFGEARTASSLNHRNIVTIFEVGESGGQPFLAMELIDGRTLRQLAAGVPVPMRRDLDLIVQVAEGLSAAHEASLVHRDLKPENLMVTRDGTVKILDFGLAKPFGAAATGELAKGLAKTSTGIVVGTASYMAPEQARGRPVDFRSDQFCLGLILYELLTGRKAFDKASAAVPSRPANTSTPAPVPEAGAHRAARVLATALGALLLLGGGAGIGWWMRDRSTDTPPSWGGDLVLGNTTQVLASRISPDGQTPSRRPWTAGPSTTLTAATSGPSTSTETSRRRSSAQVTASPPFRTARSSSSSATA